MHSPYGMGSLLCLHLAHLLLEDILGRHAAYAKWRKAHAWGLRMLRYGTEGRLISYYT